MSERDEEAKTGGKVGSPVQCRARVMEVNTARARRKLRSHEGSGQRGALEQWR